MNKSNVKHVGQGKILSETQYYTVDSVNSRSVVVVNDRGLKFGIDNNIVEEGMYSADQFSETEKITKTQMAELFSHIGDTVFTVNFNKQVKKIDVQKTLDDLYANKDGKILSKAEYSKLVKKALASVYDGEERTLIGYRIGSDFNLGRSHVIDLQGDRGTNADWDARQRQVDHRSINWLVYKNVKYIIK